MDCLKKKRMYETQRDSLRNQQFNVAKLLILLRILRFAVEIIIIIIIIVIIIVIIIIL
jgi:hypothetical protein